MELPENLKKQLRKCQMNISFAVASGADYERAYHLKTELDRLHDEAEEYYIEHCKEEDDLPEEFLDKVELYSNKINNYISKFRDKSVKSPSNNQNQIKIKSTNNVINNLQDNRKINRTFELLNEWEKTCDTLLTNKMKANAPSIIDNDAQKLIIKIAKELCHIEPDPEDNLKQRSIAEPSATKSKQINVSKIENLKENEIQPTIFDENMNNNQDATLEISQSIQDEESIVSDIEVAEMNENDFNIIETDSSEKSDHKDIENLVIITEFENENLHLVDSKCKEDNLEIHSFAIDNFDNEELNNNLNDENVMIVNVENVDLNNDLLENEKLNYDQLMNENLDNGKFKIENPKEISNQNDKKNLVELMIEKLNETVDKYSNDYDVIRAKNYYESISKNLKKYKSNFDQSRINCVNVKSKNVYKISNISSSKFEPANYVNGINSLSTIMIKPEFINQNVKMPIPSIKNWKRIRYKFVQFDFKPPNLVLNFGNLDVILRIKPPDLNLCQCANY